MIKKLNIYLKKGLWADEAQQVIDMVRVCSTAWQILVDECTGCRLNE